MVNPPPDPLDGRLDLPGAHEVIVRHVPPRYAGSPLASMKLPAAADNYIKVGGLTYVTADQGKQIVEMLHSKV